MGQNNLLPQLADEVSTALELKVDQATFISHLKRFNFKTLKEHQVSDDMLFDFLMIVRQYKLNPWLREIYAVSTKNGIIPIVSIDGWAKIINTHPQFNGMRFTETEHSCTCTIYRKDREHPIEVTEYLHECFKNTSPWKEFPRRMLRHKAMIQCARYAFSFALYDPDDAENIDSEQQENTPIKVKNITPSVSPETINYISQLIDYTKSNKEGFYQFFGVLSIHELNQEQANKALEILESRKKKKEKQDRENGVIDVEATPVQKAEPPAQIEQARHIHESIPIEVYEQQERFQQREEVFL